MEDWKLRARTRIRKGELVLAGLLVFSIAALIGAMLLYETNRHSGQAKTVVTTTIVVLLGIWVFCLRLKRSRMQAQVQGSASFQCWRITWERSSGPLFEFLLPCVLVFEPIAIVILLLPLFGWGGIIGPVFGLLLVFAGVDLYDLLSRQG